MRDPEIVKCLGGSRGVKVADVELRKDLRGLRSKVAREGFDDLLKPHSVQQIAIVFATRRR